MLLWLAAHPIVSAMVALAGAVAISLTASWLAGLALAARHRSVAAAALGAPSDLARCVVGEPITLEGPLEAEGPVPRPSDGKPAAAVSVAVAERRFRSDPSESVIHLRAKQLVVRVDGKPVLLQGPIDVRAGGLQWWPATNRQLTAAAERLPDEVVTGERWTSLPHDRAVFVSVAPGERVRVRGVVADDAPAASYREQAVAYELSDVALVGMQRPRFAMPIAKRLRSPSLFALVLIALSAVAIPAYNYAEQQDACVQACFSHGACTVIQPRPLQPSFACAAMTREDCAQSSACRVEGKCTPDGEGACKVGGDEDCAASVRCAEQAHCSQSSHRNFCWLESEADCQKARACKEHGRCTKFYGECVADLAEACAATRSCITKGECKPNAAHECEVGSSADCAKSEDCAKHGYCTVISYEDELLCRPGSDEDCANCDDCRTQGECTLLRGWCAVAGDEDCAQLCASDGLCHATVAGDNTAMHPGSCRAETDADCKASAICKERSACSAAQGRCVTPSTRTPNRDPDCKRTDKCLEHGWCGVKNGGCAVTSDADCALSKPCEQLGKCSAVDGICIAKTDDDCRRSEACTLLNQCFAAAGQCMSTPPK